MRRDGVADCAARPRVVARRRAVVALLPLALGACAYFNGVYNAKDSARAADKLSRRGRGDQALGAYAVAAEKAETVLARYPKSRWRPQALYLAGRGHAMTGRCAAAEARLGEFLALPRQPGSRRNRALLALGACHVRTDRIVEGQRVLAPLLRVRDKEVATGAALWMARAAIAMGATEEVERYLSGLPASAAQWELANASLERGQYERAESLLVVRASRGDYRDEVAGALRTLWSAHRYDGVQRVVATFSAARTPSSGKISLHLLAAELLEGEARDSAARAHLLRAQSLAVDTLRTREIAARLCRLQLGAVATTAEAEAVLARCASRAAGAALIERLQDNLLLVKLLERQTDYTGTALFLAAEVARDSLRAPLYARTMFRKLSESYGNAQLSPKALLAAAALAPDSAPHYHELVRTRYPRSPYTILLDGGDPSDVPTYQASEERLRRGWTSGLALLADTLAKLRPPSSAALNAAADSAARGAAQGSRPATTPAGPPGSDSARAADTARSAAP